MPKHDMLSDFFRGMHVTLVLKQKQVVPTEHPDQFIEAHAVAQGFFLEADDRYMYLAQELPKGCSEAVEVESVFRILVTDNMEEEEAKAPPIPPSEMN